MTKKAKIAGLTGAVAIALALTGYGSYKYGYGLASEAGSHASSRTKAIVSQAKQRKWPVVVIGDSITELANLRAVCGQPTLNAGIAGARTSQLIPIAHEAIPIAKPQLVIVGLGTNDSWRGRSTDDESFISSYKAIISAAQTTGAKVVALTLPQNGADNLPSSAVFDSDVITRRNAQIRAMGVPVVDAGGAVTDPRTGHIYDGMTDDGVHPNAAGYARWVPALQKACPA